MSEVALTRTCHPVLGEGLLLPSALRAQACSLACVPCLKFLKLEAVAQCCVGSPPPLQGVAAAAGLEPACPPLKSWACCPSSSRPWRRWAGGACRALGRQCCELRVCARTRVLHMNSDVTGRCKHSCDWSPQARPAPAGCPRPSSRRPCRSSWAAGTYWPPRRPAAARPARLRCPCCRCRATRGTHMHAALRPPPCLHAEVQLALRSLCMRTSRRARAVTARAGRPPRGRRPSAA